MPALRSTHRQLTTGSLGSLRVDGPRVGAAGEVQRLLQAQQKLLSDLSEGFATADNVESRVARFPSLSRDASRALWSNLEDRQAALNFARDLAQLAPNAAVFRNLGHYVTARENYAQALIHHAQGRNDWVAAAEYAAQFARDFPKSPLAAWTRFLAASLPPEPPKPLKPSARRNPRRRLLQ